MTGKFEVYQDKAGRYRFRLKASNGEIVASGEAYETMAAVKAGCEAVREAADGAPITDVDVSEPPRRPSPPPAAPPTPPAAELDTVPDGHAPFYRAEARFWRARAQALQEALQQLETAAATARHDPAVPPEPPVGTTLLHPDGRVAWTHLLDGWHCARTSCGNCPATWQECCDIGHGAELERRLP